MKPGDIVTGVHVYFETCLCDNPGEGATIIGSLLSEQFAIVLSVKPKYEYSKPHGYHVHRQYCLVLSSGAMMLGWINENRIRIVMS